MNDLMLIDNVLYALTECPKPHFILKSDLQEALGKGELVTLPPFKTSMKFNGKYYAYHRVKQKDNEQHEVRNATDGDSGQQ